MTCAAMIFAVLAPCLCSPAAAAGPSAAGQAAAVSRPPSCHAAMAHSRHRSQEAQEAQEAQATPVQPAPSPRPEGESVQGCCCAPGSAPVAAAPAVYGTRAEPDRSPLPAPAAEPARTPFAGSAAEAAEPIFEPPRLSHPPPQLLPPLRI